MAKKSRIVIALIFVLLLSSFYFNVAEAQPDAEFVSNQLIIGVNEIDQGTLNLIKENGGNLLELIPAVNAIRVSVTSVEAFVVTMKGKPGVRYVERNVIFKAFYVPNDSGWADLWGMRIIKADYAWDISQGSASVIVAIIDTGIDYTHIDLSGRYAALGYDWVNNHNSPMDDNGHGTHTAGTAAATMDNIIGVVGVAQVSLMAEKVLGADGSGTADDVAQGIVHAADAGAKVISMSLGSYYSSNLIRDACQYAWNKGSILVAAAGNSNVNWRLYPAAYDTVIAVSATDRYDRKASYSNYGSWIELSAPGGDGSNYRDWILSTWTGGGYAWAKGTSMATPHVSGLAALIWSYQPSLTNQQLREHLRNTADDLGASGKDQYYGYGRINAYRALSELQASDSPPTVSITNPFGGSVLGGSVTVEALASDDKGVNRVEFYLDGTQVHSDSTAPYTYLWDTKTATDGAHTIKAVAVDTIGQSATDQISVTVDNTAPIVAIISPPNGATVSGTVLIQASVTETNILKVEYSVDGGTAVEMTFNSSSGYWEASWDTTKVTNGSHTIAVRAEDKAANVGNASNNVDVQNAISTNKMHVESIAFKQRGPRSLDITVTIYDNTGSPVTGATVYMAVTYPNGSTQPIYATTNGNGVALYRVNQPAKGTYTVTVTDVIHAALLYDPGANKETSDSYTVK